MNGSSPEDRLLTIENEVFPSLFGGLLSKDDRWLDHLLNNLLPDLEKKALALAEECRESGESDDSCSEEKIKELFRDTRDKLGKEHLTRERRARFPR
ncbi:MAG TPA: hypothetical protein HA257_02445 [Candidatus Methanoperedenaceae archaeon]|nr:hypothetical protein [Candidatus Methanoperedenaceae archaeon]